VGLEIFKYSMASSVVNTTSFSIKDIEFPPFILNLMDFRANYVPKESPQDFLL
jgi:hypothetical protein